MCQVYILPQPDIAEFVRLAVGDRWWLGSNIRGRTPADPRGAVPALPAGLAGLIGWVLIIAAVVIGGAPSRASRNGERNDGVARQQDAAWFAAYDCGNYVPERRRRQALSPPRGGAAASGRLTRGSASLASHPFSFIKNGHGNDVGNRHLPAAISMLAIAGAP
jgi:hypothetical protein